MADGLKRPDGHCKDCWTEGIRSHRPTPFGGPRSPLCATHHRARRTAQKAASHASWIWKTYRLTAGRYAAIKTAQGDRCALCCRATGTSRNLSVDHDHACCPGPQSCGKCLRGLLCGPCNDLLGHARDEIAFFERGIEYLKNPPAQAVKEEQ